MLQCSMKRFIQRCYQYDHLHYPTIQCSMKRFIQHCINMTIHVIVSLKYVLYDIHLHFVQSRGWICAVSVLTGHWTFVHVISMSERWPCAFWPGGLAIELMFTSGEKGLVRDNSLSKRWFNHCLTIQRFCNFVYNIHMTVFHCIASQVSYKMLFHTTMWMTRLTAGFWLKSYLKTGKWHDNQECCISWAAGNLEPFFYVLCSDYIIFESFW